MQKHTAAVEQILADLHSRQEGLSSDEVKKRLASNGPNALKSKKRITALQVLRNQFKNLILYVLFAAAIVSVYEGEIISFYVILAVILIVVVLGFVQEYQAEKAMASLTQLVKRSNIVRRDGRSVEVAREDIVVGDIVVLESGDTIPADGVVIESTQLRVDESTLTGESVPVDKKEKQEVQAGTFVVHGKGLFVVEKTGMDTSLGTIAASLEGESEPTPLQRNISHLTRTLAIVALIGSVLIFGIGSLQGAPFDEILLVALALAVASVPEGLPLTMTITLARGMKRMAKSNAVVRKLVSVETLGATDVICTDKTGTLTKNEMTVERIAFDGLMYEVSGPGYAPEGAFSFQSTTIDPADNAVMQMGLRAGVLCNNATLQETDGNWDIIGDPTEASILVLGAKAGLWKEELDQEYMRIEELVFTSERQMMSAVTRDKHGAHQSWTKGSPEAVLLRSTHYLSSDGVVELGEQERHRIQEMQQGLAESAYRVLALAYKEDVDPSKTDTIEEGLVFIGLVAMIDPPREETVDSIAQAHAAGIDVKMVTGDNKDTAKAIARKVGLLHEDDVIPTFESKKLTAIAEDRVITGDELDQVSDEEFVEVVEHIDVYARVRPEQKLRIVGALQGRSHVVAMTGDGVNDAPALKKADIGVSMGIKGTDVAKNASDMVLQDDDFATIVRAVRIGRVLYDNIEKLTVYLISRNFTEIALIFLGLITFGVEFLPLLAIHILFINLFDEILPSLGLGLDAEVGDVMERKPRKYGERLLNRKNAYIIGFAATTMALLAYAAFILQSPKADLNTAQTFAFAAITAMVLFVPFAYRNISSVRVRSGGINLLLSAGVLFSGALTLLVMYHPTLQEVFELTPIAPLEWVIPLGLGLLAFLSIEVLKRIIISRFARTAT